MATHIKTRAVSVALFLSLLFQLSGFSQFADLPRDEKTVDIGFAGDGASQTFTVTAVVPGREAPWLGRYLWFARRQR